MRGRSPNYEEVGRVQHICPAYAGMIPGAAVSAVQNANLSRVCGDDPAMRNLRNLLSVFVPRMRG